VLGNFSITLRLRVQFFSLGEDTVAVLTESLYGKITAFTPPTPESVPEPGTIIALSALGIYSVFRYRAQKAD